MRDWERIRSSRDDITDYVIHCVRDRYEEGKSIKSLTTLIDILRCGYLKPTFATRISIYDRSKRPTVRGPYPAVCFTEQTLANFLTSCEIWPKGYRPYGIALRKTALYQYGGRPAIYGSEDILGRKIRPNEPGYEKDKEIYVGGLPREYQHLWIRYQPIPNEHGYVVDWTHEREWRCRVRFPYYTHEGPLPEEGVPILLPSVLEGIKVVRALPAILVSKQQEKEVLSEILEAASPEWMSECNNQYIRNYLKLLPEAKIIALEEVKRRLAADDSRWASLETVPVEEL